VNEDKVDELIDVVGCVDVDPTRFYALHASRSIHAIAAIVTVLNRTDVVSDEWVDGLINLLGDIK